MINQKCGLPCILAVSAPDRAAWRCSSYALDSSSSFISVGAFKSERGSTDTVTIALCCLSPITRSNVAEKFKKEIVYQNFFGILYS